MPYSHIKITPYGLLGLIEGEGTFCLNDPKNMGISFSLALTYSQKSLIQAIKQFIDNYDIADTYLKYSSNLSEIVDKRSYLTIKQGTGNSKSAIEFSIRQVNFLVEKFIPMLSNLSFVTKNIKISLIDALLLP